jgi:hypothetical protein
MSPTGARKGSIRNCGGATSRNNDRLGARGTARSALVSQFITTSIRGLLKAHSCSRIEPLLYRTLVFTETWPREEIALVPTTERASAKFMKYVKNLMVWDDFPHAACVLPLLALCSGISRLTLFKCEPTMLPALDGMRIQYLSLVLWDLFGGHSTWAGDTPPIIDTRRPLFRGVTHLDLWDDGTRVAGLPIAELPALTHLSLNEEQNLSLLRSLLSSCENLHVLVNMHWKQLDLERARQAPDLVDDLRFVLMALDTDEYVADWRVGANGGQDFWARADRFVTKRKRGEISPGQHSISILRPRTNFHPSFSLTMLDCRRGLRRLSDGLLSHSSRC